jgi:ABC-type Fe3+-hydroxamate transport system substrate-binding protein
VRVVTLLPSATETLRAWGLDPIACTRFCEQPDLPTVGGTKDPDVAAIVALRPDLVVVDEEENRREDADALTAAGVPVFVTAVRSVADVAPTLQALARAVGAAPSVLGAIPATYGPERAQSPPAATVRAFVPIWRRPWMTVNGDTYGSSLLAHVGVANVYADAPARYPEVDLDDARSRAPGVVIAPSEPYPFAARHEGELAAVAPVRFVDGRDLFWWGVRTPDAVGRLRAELNPRQCGR